MQGNLNAFSLITIIIFSIIFIYRYAEKPGNYIPIVKGLIFFLFFFSIFVGLKPIIQCGARAKFIHWFIPVFFSSIAIITVRNYSIKILFISLVFLGAFVITFHYIYLVCGKNYTNSPVKTFSENSKLDIEVMELKEIISNETDKNNRYYPEGFISESLTDLDLSKFNNKRYYVEAEAAWHTFFSGIYLIKKTPIAFWYPGGKLKNSYNKIKYQKLNPPSVVD